MKFRILGKIRLLVLILIALLVLAGMFPGMLTKLWGAEAGSPDSMFVLLMVYFLTFVLILFWLILVAIERRWRDAEVKELEH